MPLKKQVKDIMIPMDKYAVVSPDTTLQVAVGTLRQSYCELETGMCKETGPRTIMVVGADGKLAGIIDFRSILRVLVPEVAGTISQKLSALGVSIAFAQADAESHDVSSEDLVARIRKNAQVKAEDIMLKSVAHIDGDTTLLEALKLIFRKKIIVLPVYENNRFVGVVRDADLVLAVADMLP